MKIVYLLTHDITIPNGVTKKVLRQAEHWRLLNHQVFVLCILPRKVKEMRNSISSKDVFLFSMSDFYVLEPQGLMKKICDINPDIVYCRFEPYKPFLAKICKRFKTIIEINSDDVGEYRLLGAQSLKYRIFEKYNAYTRRMLFKNVQGMVFVTEELLNSENFSFINCQKVCVPNSINLDEIVPIKEKLSGEIPRLIFIGTPGQPWHGVDKIKRLAAATAGVLEIVVVGANTSDDDVNVANLKCYAWMKHSEYDALMRTAHIGIGSLALHRKGMDEACPLKVREYVAYGLPIIVGYHDTALRYDKKKWVLEITNEEENVEKFHDAIVEFSYKWKDFTVPFEDKEMWGSTFWESKRLDFFQQIVSRNEDV